MSDKFLYGKVASTSRAVPGEYDGSGDRAIILHLCRDGDGSLFFGVGWEAVTLDREAARWLAGVLNGALDSWPVVEG